MCESNSRDTVSDAPHDVSQFLMQSNAQDTPQSSLKSSSQNISVVIPLFNTLLFLEECLQSVLKQPYVTEVIVVDDHSTDGSTELAQSIARMDARVQVLTNIGKGTADARNTGCAQATGEWVWSVDADDVLPSDATTNYFTAINANSADIIGAGASWLGPNHTLTPMPPTIDYPRNTISTEQDLLTLLGRRIVGLDFPRFNGPIWNFLFRREFIESHHIEAPSGVRIGQDGIFLARALMHHPRIVWTDACVYYYRTAAAKGNYKSTTSRYIPHIEREIETILDTRKTLCDTLQLLQPGEQYLPLVPTIMLWNLYTSDFPHSKTVRISMLRDISRRYCDIYGTWVHMRIGGGRKEYYYPYLITLMARYCPYLADMCGYFKPRIAHLVKRLRNSKH